MPEPLTPQGNPLRPQTCVLDTHVVLEAFWFADPRVAPVLGAIRSGRLQWRATPAMRAELAEILDRLPDRSQAIGREQALTSFDRWTVIEEPGPARERVWCTDPDDQMFVDLALATGARWLFTRDHALRRLARRAAPLGCAIVPPERYAAAMPVTAGIAPGT